jgi:hypothetical protein
VPPLIRLTRNCCIGTWRPADDRAAVIPRCPLTQPLSTRPDGRRFRRFIYYTERAVGEKKRGGHTHNCNISLLLLLYIKYITVGYAEGWKKNLVCYFYSPAHYLYIPHATRIIYGIRWQYIRCIYFLYFMPPYILYYYYYYCMRYIYFSKCVERAGTPSVERPRCACAQ